MDYLQNAMKEIGKGRARSSSQQEARVNKVLSSKQDSGRNDQDKRLLDRGSFPGSGFHRSSSQNEESPVSHVKLLKGQSRHIRCHTEHSTPLSY
jgi:hypothetical protein